MTAIVTDQDANGPSKGAEEGRRVRFRSKEFDRKPPTPNGGSLTDRSGDLLGGLGVVCV